MLKIKRDTDISHRWKKMVMQENEERGQRYPVTS